MVLMDGVDLTQLGAALVMAAFLATVINRLVEMLIKPVFERYGWDNFWLMYVSWFAGTALVLLTNIDIFYFVDWRYPVVGTILTGIVAGGGANFIHDMFDSLLALEDRISSRGC